MTAKQNSIRIIILIAFFVTVGQLFFDLYSPSLPAIADQLQISVGATQASITIFLISFGLSQLFYGPISDNIGRKPVLLTGLIILMFGAILIFFTDGIKMLYLARFIQGAGAGSVSVLSRAVARDYFEEKDLARALSILMMAVTVTPAIAPLIGGLLQDLIGWKLIFACLLAYAFIAFIVICCFLPETNKFTKTQKLKTTTVIANYGKLIRHKTFITYMSLSLISYVAIVFYITIAPFIFQDHFGLSASSYGLLIAIPAACYFAGSFLSNLFNKKLHYDSVIAIGAASVLISGLFLYSIVLFDMQSVDRIIAAVCFIPLGVGLIRPNTITGLLMPFAKKSGTVAALNGFIQMTGCGIIGIAVSHFHLTQAKDLAYCIMACGVVMLCILVFTNKIKFK
jgi:MFS transporter, DHA1 family, 2-module integral membrane pump EmrD